MNKKKITIKFRIPQSLNDLMIADLRRPHSFAFERVGFLYTKSKFINNDTVVIIATQYEPVNDNNYIQDNSVGAKIDSSAIRQAMQKTIDMKGGCFHVHLHDHLGKPYPSYTDQKGLPGVVHSLSNVTPNEVHGILILSENGFYSEVKLPFEKKFYHPYLISSVGYPMNLQFDTKNITNRKNKIYNRQSFLGANSQKLFENIKVGIVGYGGGGSHIGQQLAHIGVKNIVIFDPDKLEDTNHNRLVGGWFTDIKKGLLKTALAKRTIKKILPDSNVECVIGKWQENSDILQQCDVIFGGVDSYSERNQLEAECRRYLIPHIDIGMDVHKIDDEPYSMSGQIILSMPGMACMNCFGFLTEKKLAIEAAKYGNIGGRPQVVWPNGVLASTAVGIFVDLVTGWSGQNKRLVYLAYDGNMGLIHEHVRMKYTPVFCDHYKTINAGPIVFEKI